MKHLWRHLAACKNEDPELFFPPSEDQFPYAVDICYACPVRKACAAEALKHGERQGIWAGIRLSWKDTPEVTRARLQEVINR